jgi:undecaprenyl-diphosphatase
LKKNKKRWILSSLLSLFSSFLVSYIIKIIIKRPRPFAVDLTEPLKIAFLTIRNNFNTWNFSFPSGDAIIVFSILPIISQGSKKLKYVWLCFSILVALSRVYFGVHYLSDAIAGSVIGFIIGYIFVKLEKKYKSGLKLIEKIL